MASPSISTLNWATLAKAQTPPYTIYLWIAMFLAQHDAGNSGAMIYDNVSGRALQFGRLTLLSSYTTIRVERITSLTTDSSNVASIDATIATNPICYIVNNNGTTITLSVSMDGYNLMPVHSEAVGAFLTPTHIGFGALSEAQGTGVVAYANLLGYTKI
jgi:hypothetical protein